MFMAMNLQFLEQQQQKPTFLLQNMITFFSFLVLTIFLAKRVWPFVAQKKNKNLPPSPPKLPILGNLLQLGLLPHRSLHSLSRRHGPLMLLHLGTTPTLVVSSAEAAREIFKTHDLIFSNRPVSNIVKRLFYNCKNLAFSSYGDYWRQMRSIAVMQLFSSKRVRSFRAIREEEIALMINSIICQSQDSDSGCVDLSQVFVSLTNDVVCRVAFGRKYSEGEAGRKFKKLIEELGQLMGAFDVGNFIPWLGWLSYVTGLNRRVERLFKEFDLFLDRVIDDHVAKRREDHGGDMEEEHEMGMDFVDIMFKLQEDSTIDIPIARDNIKAMLLEVFAGGTDTSFTLLEWAMTELLRHPQVMNKAQEEIRGIVGTKPTITQSDTEKMEYLRAVIKETLRMHPPLPLLVPRESSEDVEVMGYHIPARTTVMVNAWTIGRDAAYWEEPEEFRPERFLESGVDFRGHDFELIPFGAGRRGCPGITLAMATDELALATLLQIFNWALPDGAKVQDLDVTESTGLAAHRKFPLLIVPIPRSF